MGNIHVNTDVMRYLGRVFAQLNDQIEHQIQPQIQGGISQLETDWQGVSRQHFEQLFQEWRALALRLAEQGEQIGSHLQVTADRFESVDQSA